MAELTRNPYLHRGFSIPVEERIRFYYILGHSVEAIARNVSNEFQEFELDEISPRTVRKFIAKNKEALMQHREETMLAIRRENEAKLKLNFAKAQSVEIKMVSMYSEKISELVDELEKLDLSEKTEDGYFKNMGAYATLIAAINRTHDTLEKLAGTAAAREVMVYMKKAYVKEAAAKGAGMHAAAAEAEVTFLDNPSELEQFGPDFHIEGLPKLKDVTPK